MSNIALSERINWVGGSESAAVLGVSKRKTPFSLYMEKTGLIPPDDLSGDERVNAGKYLEPAIAAWASYKWGWELEKVSDYLRHPTIKGMGASLDFRVVGKAEPVEIKNVDYLIFRDNWVAEGDAILDAPIDYLIQVQHEIACTPGAERGWLIACVGGNTLYRMELPRHAGTITAIERGVADFWDRVANNRPYDPKFSADGETIKRLYAAGGKGVIDLRSDNHLPELCSTWLQAKAEEKDACDRKEAAMAEIQHIVGDHDLAYVAGGAVVKAIKVKESNRPATVVKAHRRWSVGVAA